jgi:signal transduction histidine kinase
MTNPFTSRLFLRSFLTTLIGLSALFAVMFLLSVPFIERTVGQIEENHAKTVLGNVLNTVTDIHRNIDDVRINMVLARKLAMRDIISVVESRANSLQEKVRNKKLTLAQAKRTLLEEIRGIHYGNNDYVWASDYRSTLVAHPDPELNGADFSEKHDIHGNLIVPPMVAIARASSDGYYSYWWRRLGQEQPIEKLSYARHLPFFELIIGTGIYLDDIEAKLKFLHAKTIDELRQQLRSIRLAETGYVYIFDSHDKVIIHPNSNLEGKSLAGMIDPISQQELLPMLIAAADKPEGVRYKWDSPQNPGNYIRDKISWVRYASGFNWYIGSSVYVDELNASANTLRNRMLAVFAATLLLAIVLVYVFVARFVSPLKKISTTALAIEQGDLTTRCSVQRNDEIGVVATAFNGMVDRLRDNIQNLDTKVGERTAELERAYEELKQLDQLKSDFLSSISHEMRTPITSVIGFAKLTRKKLDNVILPQTSADEKTIRAITQVRKNLDTIVSEGERLTLLINDVMDSASLDAGKVEWHFVPLAPEHLLQDVEMRTAKQALQKGLAFSWQVQPDLTKILGDENRLRQVLMNLVSNAIKFTEYGHVILRAEQRGTFVCFSIADTGIGIAAENQETVFDKFQQIGNTLTEKPQGTGLGLSICKRIIQHHGGTLWLESAPGIGSTFYFTVPVYG